MEHGLIISAWWAATPDRNMTRITQKQKICVPSVASKNTHFMSYTSCTIGGEIKYKEVVVSQTGIKWWKIHRTSSFLHVLSQSLVDEMEPPHILFCLQWEGKRWNKETKCKKQEKKHFQHRKMCFQSLSVTVTYQNPSSSLKDAAPRAFACTPLVCL